MADLIVFVPFIAAPFLAFSVLPAFFGRFFFVLAVAASFWIGSMNHSPDSPGLVYAMAVSCVALAAILAEGVHFARRAVKRRRLAHG